LRQGDYSRWFREVIGSDELAKETAAIEGNRDLGAEESRRLISGSVRSRFTTPAKA